ncbi:MAG: thioredoxin domain-containing protein [Burkholderiales bacterium]
MSNRLAAETSPYLQQHADNPVDWHSWGEEALRLAREEDKPILLSVGYSACHWCHVMAHESFEDPQIAATMNRLFVNIKVDREERPDLDQIYQSAHHMLTQRAGGWPLTMFLTPGQKPFFGGTYFPKSPRYGLPGFGPLLEQVAQAYRSKRAEIDQQNESLLEFMNRTLPAPPGEVALTAAPITAAAADLRSSFDEVHGGLGGAPKFPHPYELAFCLRAAGSSGDTRLRELALLTLEKMAQGGIYDQLGGGFCRYSVDQYWLIPHFEKMLYDNGPLLKLYADAWLITGNPLFARVCEETAAWVMREMQSSEGGYYSSLDADSEHEEGKYYVWSREEVGALLNEDEIAVVFPHYGAERPPNFENHAWNLYVARPLQAVAEQLGREPAECERLLQRARRKLLAAREQRVRPGRDDKILTSWNALMIEGMAHAARALGREDWLASAWRALDFLCTRMWKEARLLATYKDGRAHLNAYVDDYAFLLAATLEMLQAEFRKPDLEFAIGVADALLEHFEDRGAGGFFFTSHDHEQLILRPKPGHDNATPSGNGVAALALTRLGHLLGETRYLRAAEATVRLFYPAIAQHPAGFATLCTALAEVLEPTQTVVLRGPRQSLREWQQALSRLYLPDTLMLALDSAAEALPGPLDKPAGAAVNAYLCRGVNCLAPIRDLDELVGNLRSTPMVQDG